ncbi:bifunctional pantoate--beta-alanine ligase/(d)CMP kinase [Pseudanabaena sp. UWO311]|uniref:bifunctional pantoate--beta-alanine ligase/(d)CMP kinase n=1 Tax=Pseudanabaena sp. UWO311 TaxID=2487337 RepID=UPI001157AC95|nr:bifunctional pantoate--beta-alanine ligase/(d)CMP kinase [Pseudanabaena sp. UWO311]TYQ24117.1 bifunctional pantoate--beta-alanine ligase/(d)CMP kinase [Pseudanabaena sp. UWO311]
MTQLFTTIASLRNYLNTQKEKQTLGQVSVGLVPTMGALHIGHLSLIDRARTENSCLVVSIFVNPLQFGAGEDFDQYPRTLENDLQICENAGVDAVFAPDALEMGVSNIAKITQVIPPPEMINILCGRSRVVHFQGVATIVTKLLNAVQPDRAYFGNKDGQQLAIIRQLVIDLNLSVEVIGCPTVREPSGLAYSSRNQYLSSKERILAAHIYQSLLQSQQQFFLCYELCKSAQIIEAARNYLAKLPEIHLEYIELVDAKTLQPCNQITFASELMLAIAARIGNTRLIDNILLSHTITPRNPIIAIDGPAGAGKSTVTKQVANKLGLLFLDTGAMYRSVTLAVLREGIDLRDQEKVQAIATKSKIQLFANPIAGKPMQVLLNGEDITDEIRTPEVTANVSSIAAQSAVREILVKQQQLIGQTGGVVMEGRDIGTHVFPDAEVKIFLTASAEERAKRRQADLIAQGQVAPDLATLEQEIQERDRKDSTRDHAPLIQAEDATLVNTDGLTIEEVVAAIVNLYEQKVQNR